MAMLIVGQILNAQPILDHYVDQKRAHIDDDSRSETPLEKGDIAFPDQDVEDCGEDEGDPYGDVDEWAASIADGRQA